jgi:RNA polymerase sigma-70 factor (ECF subfamily)
MKNSPRDVHHETLVLISEGDTSAFSLIFKMYYRPLVLFANAIVKDSDVAEDLVQAFFCKLWEERESLARVTCCKGYFYQAIRNGCQNYCRHQRVVARLPPPEEGQEKSILQAITEEEVYLELIRQVERLPGKCREVMLLKLQGMDTLDIATACRVTEETVRSHYRHGKDLLRKQLRSLFKESLLLPLLLAVVDGL